MFLNSIPQTPNLIICTLQKAFQKKEVKERNKTKSDYTTKRKLHKHTGRMILYKRRKISKKQFCYNHSLRKYIQLSLRKVKKIHAIYITSS